MKTLTVSKEGAIHMEGRKYISAELLPFAGQQINAFVDPSINRADAVCIDLNGHFITNAQNPEKWAELTA